MDRYLKHENPHVRQYAEQVMAEHKAILRKHQAMSEHERRMLEDLCVHEFDDDLDRFPFDDDLDDSAP